jgi:hypothetical protein
VSSFLHLLIFKAQVRVLAYASSGLSPEDVGLFLTQAIRRLSPKVRNGLGLPGAPALGGFELLLAGVPAWLGVTLALVELRLLAPGVLGLIVLYMLPPAFLSAP